jgi:GNAT superfamily N-acetyltransferase
MPLAPPNSDQLKAAQTRAIRRLLLDPTEAASARFDALCCLAGRLKHDKRGLDACARLARSKRLALAVPAAAHLAQAKDQRGITGLRRWLRNSDSGLAAISALMLVFEAFDERAADVLVKLSGKQDLRFQLSAGYALRLAGDRRADRFAFENLDGCRVKVVQDGFVKAFSVVDGYETANTFCLPQFAPAGHGAHYSDYYVAWVHTDPHWRRRGLARLSFVAALDHRWHKTCAATSLHTGTTNVAHTLYRGCGLIDYTVHHTFHRKLHDEAARRPPRGITIRPLRRSDLAAAGEMLNEYVAGRPHARIRLSQLLRSCVAYRAFDGRRTVGLAWARPQGDGAVLEHLAVAKLTKDEQEDDRKRRERTGEAILSALHGALRRHGVKLIETNRWVPRGTIDDSFTRSLLRHCGYGLRREGLVEQRRVNDLVRYFTEIAGALEKRLAANTALAGWTGAVWIDGRRLRACLRFRHGRVTVTSRRPTQPTLAICGDETAIERIAMGLATPFEESLQTQVTVSPMLNASTTDLLETLFPCVVRYL